MADKNSHKSPMEFSWQVPEKEDHERGKSWYLKAIIIAFALLTFAFLSANFLFAVIIVIVTLILVLGDKEKNIIKVKVLIDKTGVKVGKKFHDYDEIKDFAIVYKPHLGVKNLYFEFNNWLQHRLSIPLEDQDPLALRKFLIQYLPEDTDRTDQPLSEALAKFFKL